ncbi:hypothetical protein GGU11DRAFT_280584 [Lentinula aff. detonsa]|nr:hypothetical protein GGU11DRAFT_280584 [Lentinula aff. detonsa]
MTYPTVTSSYKPLYNDEYTRTTMLSPAQMLMDCTCLYCSNTPTRYHYPPAYLGWSELPCHLHPLIPQEVTFPALQNSKSSPYESTIPSLSSSRVAPEEAHGIFCLGPLLSSGDFLPDHRRREIHRLEAAYEELEGFTSSEERAIAQATFNLLLRKKEEEEKVRKREEDNRTTRNRERFIRLQKARFDLLKSCVLEVEAPSRHAPVVFSPLQDFEFFEPAPYFDCHRELFSRQREVVRIMSRLQENVLEVTREGHWRPWSPIPNIPHPTTTVLSQKATWPPSTPSSPMLPHPDDIFRLKNATWPPEAPPAYMLPDPNLVFHHHE